MRIDGAILDLDGTLLDSMPIWENLAENYLRSLGIEPRENLNEKFKNLSLYQAACYYQKAYGLTASTDEIIAGINSMIERFYTDEVLPKPGVPAFLAEMSKRRVKMCIATATDRHLVEAALLRLNLLPYFEEIFTCSSVGHGKDEPDIYHAARQFLRTPKFTTWVFEDALYAIETAKRAGYRVVGVFDPSSADQEEEIRAISDRYIRSFEEMKDLLYEEGAHDSRF